MTDRFDLYHGDVYKWAQGYNGARFHACLCDPPYELGFMGKKWDSSGVSFQPATWAAIGDCLLPGAFLLAFGGTRTWHRLAVAIEDAGFEIRDTIMYVYGSGFPKGHDVAWNMHKMACKSCGVMVEYDHDNQQTTRGLQETEHNLRFVRATYLQTPVYACAECGQVLQPFLSEQESQELRAAWQKSEIIWPEQPGLERRGDIEALSWKLSRCPVCQMSHGIFADGAERWLRDGASASNGKIPWQIANKNGSSPSYRPQSIQQLHHQLDAFRIERRAQSARGYNVALKPAWEPVIVARKPLDGTVAENCVEYGAGALWIDGGRVGNPIPYQEGGWHHEHIQNDDGWIGNKQSPKQSSGRWPANFCHDGSDEVVGLFPMTKSGTILPHHQSRESENRAMSGKNYARTGKTSIGDSGSAARFFYCAKASKRERDAGCEGLEERNNMRVNAPRESEEEKVATLLHNHHPTVKPIALTEYLARLILPPAAYKPRRLLVPFCGSGSEIIGALRAGWDYAAGIDISDEYLEIARLRVGALVPAVVQEALFEV